MKKFKNLGYIIAILFFAHSSRATDFEKDLMEFESDSVPHFSSSPKDHVVKREPTSPRDSQDEPKTTKRIKSEDESSSVDLKAKTEKKLIWVPRQCGVWRQTLDYEFEGKVWSSSSWHTKVGVDVKRKKETVIKQEEDEAKGNSNFAKARVEAIVLKNGAKQKRLKFELPYMFSSSTLTQDKDCFSLTQLEQLVAKEGLSDNKVIDFIKKLHEDSEFATEELKKKYYHTELGILYFLANKSEWIDELFKKKGSYILKHLTLTICSYYDPCSECSLALFQAGKRDGFITSQIMQRLKEKQIVLAVGFGLNVSVSSHSEYYNSREYLRANPQSQYANCVKIPQEVPYFAQMSLNMTIDDMPYPDYSGRFQLPSEFAQMPLRKLLSMKEERKSDPNYLFYMAYNGIGGVKEELVSQHPQLGANLTPVSQIGSSQFETQKEGFEALHQASVEKSKMEIRTDREGLLEDLLGAMECYLSPHHKKLIDNYRNDLKSIHEERQPTSKDSREKIIASYINKTKCVDGDKISKVIMNTAFLLKVYGYMYLNDSVNVSKFPIPERWKELKIKKKQSRTLQNDASEPKIKNLSERLQEIQEDEENDYLKQVAKFFHEQFEIGGKFKTDEKSKYHWEAKNQ